jgi:hypothetical protein
MIVDQHNANLRLCFHKRALFNASIEWNNDLYLRAFAGSALHEQPACNFSGPLAHSQQPEMPVARQGRSLYIKATPIIAHIQAHILIVELQDNRDFRGLRMPRRIVKRFVRNA